MPKDKEEKLEELDVPQAAEVSEETEAIEAEVPAAEEEVASEAITPDPIEQEDIPPSVELGSASVEQNGDEPVTIQSIKFASFEDLNQTQGETNKNLDILMDIKLQLTVELGRTELPIKKVLELTRGSIIELEKVAGEPVELYANGKLIANGEVVVIEDNFGLRITSITDPDERLKGIQ